jgi:hypothetical protein
MPSMFGPLRRDSFKDRLRDALRRRPYVASPSETGASAPPLGRTSAPPLHAIWLDLRHRFFPERGDLDDYVVVWSSRRQIRTLASCNLRTRRILVARELLGEELARWLPPLLYHEMCHAVLGLNVRQSGGKRRWHGAEFKRLEARHPETALLHQWVQSGGWARAVRSDRARRSFRKGQKRR